MYLPRSHARRGQGEFNGGQFTTVEAERREEEPRRNGVPAALALPEATQLGLSLYVLGACPVAVPAGLLRLARRRRCRSSWRLVGI